MALFPRGPSITARVTAVEVQVGETVALAAATEARERVESRHTSKAVPVP